MTDPLFGEAPVSARVAAIRALTAAGFTLIPLRGKAPVADEWQKTPRGAYGEHNLAGNYGIAVPAHVVVVDIDPRNFRPGDNPVARLVERIGAGLDSFTVRSGGGGLHVYLRKPADMLVKNSLKDFPGVEFKSLGRQLVGPGSIHPDSGKEYAVVSGSPDDLAEAPPALLALIHRTVVPFEEVGTGRYVNDAGTQGRYVDYLEHNAPASGSFAVACYGRDLGLPPAITWELMCEVWAKRRTTPRTPEELRAKVVHAYRYASGAVGNLHPAADFKDAPPAAPEAAAAPAKEEELSWVTSRQGAVQKCFQNLVTFLKYPKAGMVGVFGYNEFTGRVEFCKPAPWHHGRMPGSLGVGDHDLKLLKGHLAMRHGFEMPVQNIEEAVTNVAHANRHHPVRDWLGALKWDGTPRLDTWLQDHLGVADSEYARACSRKVLCAAVKRVTHPGCKFDHVLILEGRQRIGKSTVIDILGAPWSGDFAIDPHNKDTIQLMQGRWIIELAEMEVTRRADLQALKAFVTRRKDEARLAYGRTVGEFPRQSIFIGTINPGAHGTYLQDETGNTRWWPVWCDPKGGRVDFAAFKAAREQLFAEAVLAVKGEKEVLYMETTALEQQAAAVAGERHAEHEWAERIGDWLAEKERAEVVEYVTSRQVYIEAMGGVDKQLDRRATLAIASALRELGWERGFRRVGGRFTRVFVRTLGQQARVLADVRDTLGSFA